jgi:hypothetical protein
MAKKRGGGSSPGLVITLVFFILSTIGLGVATYYGFAEQGGLEKTIANEKKVTETFKAERDFCLFQGRVYRLYMTGEAPATAKAAEIAKEKVEFDTGNLRSAKADSQLVKAEKDEMTVYLKGLNKDMPWPADKEVPTATWKSRLEAAERARGEIEKQAQQYREERDAAMKARDTAKAERDDFEQKFKAALTAAEKKAVVDLASDRESITRAQELAKEEGKKATAALAAQAKAEKERDDLTRERNGLKTNLTKLNRDHKSLKEQFDELQEKHKRILVKVTTDLSAEEAEEQLLKAGQKLRTWDRNWHIVSVERLGTLEKPRTYAYINLGSKDRVTPQLTFSVHPVAPNGKIAPTPRGRWRWCGW